METVEHHKTLSLGFQDESNQRYELLIKSLETIEDYAFFTLDTEGIVQTWNHGARRIKGYFPNEIIGQHFSVFYPEEEKRRMSPHYKLQIAHDRGRFEEEGYRLRKNGEKFWASVVITAIRDHNGKVVAYSKVTKDLTDKKQAEEKLRISEERFRSLISNIKDYSICVLDNEGIIRTWNSGAERIKGYSANEVVGQHYSIFHTEKDRESGKPAKELAIAAGKDEKFEEIGWRVDKNGKKFWARVTITPIKGDNFEVIGFSKITHDITDQKKIQDLEDSIRMKDEFISVASHELRTPLTRILMNVQLMKRTGSELSERHLKSLDTCETATKELVDLMDNLVDVTRLRLGKLDLKRTKTNFTHTVMEVIARYKDDIRLSGNHLSFNHDGDVIGYWDQNRLEQLISNLLSNSIKYCQGTPIRMLLRSDEDYVTFEISDDGPGIPYHLQPKVFERFERAHDSKKISGLGLGLYVAKQIVDAHKGDITLESKPGHGASFRIKLPYKKSTAKTL